MALSGEERRRRIHQTISERNGTEAGYGRRSAATGTDTDTDPGLTGASGRSRSKRSETKSRSRAGSEGLSKLFLAAAVCVLAVLLVLAGKRLLQKKSAVKETETAAPVRQETLPPETETPEETEPPVQQRLEEAGKLAVMYDYDGAIELLSGDPELAENEEVKQAIAGYEEIKATLVRQNISEITHVFFHILCVDPENAFDSSRWGSQAGGYNSLMTTIDEFNKMLEELYKGGYVLVRLHDMARSEKKEDGTEVMKEKGIWLPPGKKALVMSEDDVCYYEYMKGAGFADRMILDKDGKPVLHYTDSEGVESEGAYDLVPLLDRFIEKHPDFSYRGAKACLVFTGYNGVLGYRTDETYDPSSELYDPALEQGHDVAAERAEAVKVMRALHEDGYELGSHSWGHRDMGAITVDHLKRDTDRWIKNVGSIIEEATGKPADIIIFPKGADINDWHCYDHSNERYDYLYKSGFRYYCNVDTAKHWVQKGTDYLRMGRRPLDGTNMWAAMNTKKDRFADLFEDVSAIFDERRPTPVPNY